MNSSRDICQDARALGVTVVPCAVLAVVDDPPILFLPETLDDGRRNLVTTWLAFVKSRVA